MARQANTIVPVRFGGKATDAQFNDNIAEMVDTAIQMVGQINTPFLSQCKTSTARTTVHTWTQDTYMAAENTARPYGDQMTPEGYKPETQRYTVQQTIHKTNSVSEEEERTKKHGYGSLINRIMMKQGIALRLGEEKHILTENQGSQIAAGAGAGSPADNGYVAKTPALQGILFTHSKVGTKGSPKPGGWSQANDQSTYQGSWTARTAATEGTAKSNTGKVVLTLDDTLDLIDDIKKANSTPMPHRQLWMGRDLKAEFSGFNNEGIGAMRTQVGMGAQGQITRGISMITTDLGETVTLNWSPTFEDNFDAIYNVNASDVEICYMFRNLRVKLAKKGLSEEFGLATNFGVKVKKEPSAGVLYDRITKAKFDSLPATP